MITRLYNNKRRLHSDGNPSYVQTINSVIREEKYHRNGKLHRVDGPAYIRYSIDGNINREVYYKNGIKHRLDGPAHIFKNPLGHNNFIYYKNGKKFYTEEHPSEINEYASLTQRNYMATKRVSYYIDRKLHRNDGAAVIWYRGDTIVFEEYWLDGVILNTQLVKDNPSILVDAKLRKILL